MEQLYDKTRKLAGKHKQTEGHIKDKKGGILTSEGDRMKRRKEHFEEMLNRLTPVNLPDIPPAEEIFHIKCEKSSKLLS